MTSPTMLALYLQAGQTSLKQVSIPRPEPFEARIRVRYAGFCSTDLHLIHGYKGFDGVLGHEFVGVVDQCDSEPAWVGQRVVGELNIGCEACVWCRSGNANHCAQRRVLGILNKDGCFASWITLPTRLLHRVPASLDDRDAVFVEPLAAALRILEQVDIRPEMSVAVLGDGKLGLLVGQVMTALSPAHRVVQIGRHARKLALAASWGATTCGLDNVELFDLVVEVTGTSDGLAQALKWVKPEGTVVLKSTFHGLASVDVSRVVVTEVRLVGSRCGPFQTAIEALEQNRVNVRSLVDATYSLEQGLEALSHASRRGVLKILLDMRSV